MLVFTLALLASGADPVKPEFSYTDFSRPADKVAASVEKNKVVFTVTSTRGIGGATINLKEGAWPREVVILLTYEDGKGFKSLENFRLATDRVVAAGSIKSSGKVPFAFLGAKGEGEKEMVPDESGGTLDIKIVQTDKAIELRFPPNLLNGSKLVTLSWIDAYRR